MWSEGDFRGVSEIGGEGASDEVLEAFVEWIVVAGGDEP